MNWRASAQAKGESHCSASAAVTVWGCTTSIAHPGRFGVYMKPPDELALVSNF